nr:MAG TPA: hypothetical protein [Caudoviricetes sp.]
MNPFLMLTTAVKLSPLSIGSSVRSSTVERYCAISCAPPLFSSLTGFK